MWLERLNVACLKREGQGKFLDFLETAEHEAAGNRVATQHSPLVGYLGISFEELDLSG